MFLFQNGRKTEVSLVVAEPVHEHPGTACLRVINSGPQQAKNRLEAVSFDQVPLHLLEILRNFEKFEKCGKFCSFFRFSFSEQGKK